MHVFQCPEPIITQNVYKSKYESAYNINMKKIFNKTNFSIIAPLLCIGAVSTVLTTTSCSNAYISLETDDSFDASEINTSEGGCLYEITNG
jgi:hypothetical protein